MLKFKLLPQAMSKGEAADLNEFERHAGYPRAFCIILDLWMTDHDCGSARINAMETSLISKLGYVIISHFQERGHITVNGSKA